MSDILSKLTRNAKAHPKEKKKDEINIIKKTEKFHQRFLNLQKQKQIEIPELENTGIKNLGECLSVGKTQLKKVVAKQEISQEEISRLWLENDTENQKRNA